MGNEARVKEQSHKSEMRAALRGDFERLQARRRTVDEVEAAPLPEEPAVEPVAAAAEPVRLSWLERLRDRR